MRRLFFICFLLAANIAFAQDDVTYKTPPKEIVDLVMAKPTPGVVINNSGEWMILLERSDLPHYRRNGTTRIAHRRFEIEPKEFRSKPRRRIC